MVIDDYLGEELIGILIRAVTISTQPGIEGGSGLVEPSFEQLLFKAQPGIKGREWIIGTVIRAVTI